MTASYRVLVKKSAEGELRSLPKKDLRRVMERIRALAGDARPSGCEKLSGQDRYRVRQDDYPMVYAIDDEHHIVEIVKVGHRREVYRG